MIREKIKNPPVCALWWYDAAYTYEGKLPTELPQPQLTVGFIMTANDDYVNIATNVRYKAKDGSIWPVDGFIFPKKTITKFKKIRLLHDE